VRCPHCHQEIFREKSHVIRHDGETISLRELSRRSGIAYSTLQNRYDKGLRGVKLVGPIDMRRSTTKSKSKTKQERPRSEISGLVRQFLLGGVR